ncbi:MAG: MarR family winged helix-turn-helix transcriptional regulator [Bacteroidales bacterium]
MNDYDSEILGLPFNLYRTAIAIRSEITRRLSAEFKEDFTADYWYILDVLMRNEPLSSAQLADLTGRDRASISRSLGCMERLDLIHRIKNPSNKRSELISTTQFAVEFKSRAETIIRRIIDDSLKGLKPIEVMELNRMLMSISSKMIDSE